MSNDVPKLDPGQECWAGNRDEDGVKIPNTNLSMCEYIFNTTDDTSPSYDYVYQSPEEWAFLAIYIAGCLVLAYLMWYIYVNMNKAVVKRAGYSYLLTIQIGYACLLMSLFLWPKESNQALCLMKPWFIALGYGLIAGPLLVKIYRAHYMFYLALHPRRSLERIIHYNSEEKLAIRNRNMRFISIGIVVVELLLCLCMVLIPMVKPELIYTCCNNGRVYRTCQFSAGFGWAAFIINAIPLVFGLYWVGHIYAVHRYVKKLSESVDESEASSARTILRPLRDEFALLKPVIWMISIVGVVGAVIVIIGYTDQPINKLTVSDVESQRTSYYIARSLCFMIVIMSTMFICFLPVIRGIRNENNRPRHEDSQEGDLENRNNASSSHNISMSRARSSLPYMLGAGPRRRSQPPPNGGNNDNGNTAKPGDQLDSSDSVTTDDEISSKNKASSFHILGSAFGWRSKSKSDETVQQDDDTPLERTNGENNNTNESANTDESNGIEMANSITRA